MSLGAFSVVSDHWKVFQWKVIKMLFCCCLRLSLLSVVSSSEVDQNRLVARLSVDWSLLYLLTVLYHCTRVCCQHFSPASHILIYCWCLQPCLSSLVNLTILWCIARLCCCTALSRYQCTMYHTVATLYHNMTTACVNSSPRSVLSVHSRDESGLNVWRHSTRLVGGMIQTIESFSSAPGK